MHSKKNFECFSRPLQTLCLSSVVAITVLEHPPFPSPCLHTPAHAVPLPCISPCAERDVVLDESNPAGHPDNLTSTWGRHSAETLLCFCTMSTPFMRVGLCSRALPVPSLTLSPFEPHAVCTPSEQVLPSTWGCTENTWLFHCYLEREACVHILAWGAAQLLSRTSISGFFTIPTLSARRKLNSWVFPKRITTVLARALR